MPTITEGNYENIPKGTYIAAYAGIENKALPLGDCWEWSFTIKQVEYAHDPNDDLDDDDEPVKSPEDFIGETLKDVTSTFLSKNAKATKWVMALLGMSALPVGPDGKIAFSFDWEDLEGKWARVTVGHKDNGWPKILELSPYKKKGAPKQRPTDDDEEPGLPVGRAGRRTAEPSADEPF